MATRHYLKLDGRLQIADISRDERTLAELSPLVKLADDERSALRRQIERHEAQSQAGAATA